MFDLDNLELPNQEHQVPEGWIGCVGSMSLVCISLKDEDYDNIYISSYVVDPGKDVGDLLVANSFTEFINGFEEYLND